ncbi:MAG: uL15 family ribosomal protein [Patescibacteria group bacterium]
MQIKRTHPNKEKKYIGRGGKRGKTSGRGMKGQKARAGNKIRPAIRDIIKKLPRLRGVTINKRGSMFTTVRLAPVTVTLSALESVFSAGDKVTREILLEKGLVKKRYGRTPKVKILNVGVITKKLEIKGVSATARAKKAVEKVGGSIN